MSEIPESWVEVCFRDINTFVACSVDPSAYPEELFELYSVPTFPTRKPEMLLGSEIGSTKQVVEPGDVLVCKINPRINRVWQVMAMEERRQIASSEWIVMRAPGLSGRFLRYYFSSPGFRELICEGVTGVGGSLTRAQPKRVADFPIPVAPLSEQKCIADKLDAVLARVDGCSERLGRIPGILKRLRRSVLADAVCGKLTSSWRGSEPESEVALPQGWRVCQIKDAGKIQLGRQRSPKFHAGESMRPYFRVQNVFEDRLDLSDVMAMDFPGEDIARYELHPGDILLNEGQSPEYLGRPAMYRGELPGVCFTNTLIRFQAYEHVLPEYALLVFRHQMHSGPEVSPRILSLNQRLAY